LPGDLSFLSQDPEGENGEEGAREKDEESEDAEESLTRPEVAA
jgi:hypothetical protein